MNTDFIKWMAEKVGWNTGIFGGRFYISDSGDNMHFDWELDDPSSEFRMLAYPLLLRLAAEACGVVIQYEPYDCLGWHWWTVESLEFKYGGPNTGKDGLLFDTPEAALEEGLMEIYEGEST